MGLNNSKPTAELLKKLSKKTVSEVANTEQKSIRVVTHDDTVGTLLQVFAKHRLDAVPVVDAHHNDDGMVDTLDLLAWVAAQQKHHVELSPAQVLASGASTAINFSRSNPVIFVSADTTMEEALGYMAKPSIHRLCLRDAKHNIRHIIDERMLLGHLRRNIDVVLGIEKFLSKRVEKQIERERPRKDGIKGVLFRRKKHTPLQDVTPQQAVHSTALEPDSKVHEMTLLLAEDVMHGDELFTIDSALSAWEAFTQLHRSGYESAPIVGPDHKLLGNLSASDVSGLVRHFARGHCMKRKGLSGSSSSSDDNDDVETFVKDPMPGDAKAVQNEQVSAAAQAIQAQKALDGIAYDNAFNELDAPVLKYLAKHGRYHTPKTVAPEAAMSQVIRTMADHDVTHVFVVTPADGRIHGIITVSDVFSSLLKAAKTDGMVHQHHHATEQAPATVQAPTATNKTLHA